MDFLLFHVFLLPGTNILRWEWEELQAIFAYFLQFFSGKQLDAGTVILHCLFCGGQIGRASRLHISLANTVSLQGSCNQMWPNLMLKWSTLHSKTTRNPYFVSHYVSSPIPWRNSRDDPEFDRFKSWTRRPSVFSCQALFECLRQNSALKNLNLWENEIGAEGAKAGCLARIVWMRGKQANEAFSKWRQREWTFVLKWEVGSREYVIIPC